MTRVTGSVAIVLHAHEPFVRHPDVERHPAEQRFFESLSAVTLPLLELLERLAAEQVPTRLAVAFSPTLMAMLDDPLLRERFSAFLARQVEEASVETSRPRLDPPRKRLAEETVNRYEALRNSLAARGADLLSGFAALERAGRIELLTTSATHAVLPLLAREESRRLQIELSVDRFEARFGHAPHGFWLPERAYAPGLERTLARRRIGYSILEPHGLLLAEPFPPQHAFAPVATEAGVAFFSRDPRSMTDLMNASQGYRADPETDREAADENGKFLCNSEKTALEAAHHAADFVTARARDLWAISREQPNRPPVLVCTVPASLFGGSWREGPLFLERVLRGLAAAGIQTVTPREYLAGCGPLPIATPSPSTSGKGGYFEPWLSDATAFYQRYLRLAEETFWRHVARGEDASPLPQGRDRLLLQMGHEMLLAQSSDWTSTLFDGQGVEYALERLEGHLRAAQRLARFLDGGRVDWEWVSARESQWRPFPSLDVGWLSKRIPE